MPTFDYIGMDRRGVERRGRGEAASAGELVGVMRASGLFLTRVEPVQEGDGRPGVSHEAGWWSWLVRWRSSRDDLVLFTRQLATLLRAGLPLARALEVVARQSRGGIWREMAVALGEHLRAGGTLAEALARHPRVFDRTYVGMVRAGEAGGALGEVLGRVAGYLEKAQRLRRRVAAAVAYPIVVLLAAAGILAGLLVFVVPRFERLFADLLKGAPLPGLTQAVVATGTWVQGNAWALAAGGAGLALGVGWMRRTTRGARAWDRWLLRLPVAGPLLRCAAVARLARTLGTLLGSGVPILPALLITRDTCGNRAVAELLARAHERVTAGEPLSRPLAAAGLLPAAVASLVEVGELTGRLPEMLGQVAEMHEEELDAAVAGLGAILEPLLVLVLAVVVGVIVVALFLPILRIVQLLT